MYHKILVGNDGSDHARLAMARAIELALCFGAELHMISVEEHLPRHAAITGDELKEKAQEETYFSRVAREARARAAERGIELRTIITPGNEVETIVKYIREEKCDLLVLGFMGHDRVFERIMGSTVSTLTRLAPCPVLIVK
jgi:nucleotide-binding universal stress UspA family protein